MNKKSNSYLALNAMRRASQQALERAASKDLKIPIWKNGKVSFVNAKDRVEFPYLHSKNKLSEIKPPN